MARRLWQTVANCLAIAALVFVINYVYLQQYEQTYSEQQKLGTWKRHELTRDDPLAKLLGFKKPENKSTVHSEDVVKRSVNETETEEKEDPKSPAAAMREQDRPTDMYSDNHELKLEKMKAQIASDPLDALLEKQAAVQDRYIKSDLGINERKEKAMLELCTKQVTCYGLGDRFFGLMGNFLIAVMAGKAFFVVHNKPADLSVHMVPNKIDWHIDSIRHAGVKEELMKLDRCDSPLCSRIVLELPGVPAQRLVDGAQNPSPIVYSWGNARTDVFFETMVLAKLFPVLKPGVPEWSAADRQFWAAHTSGRLWNHLFHFSNRLKLTADKLLSEAFKTPSPYNFKTTMLCTPCIHARTGYGLHEVPRHTNQGDFATCMKKVAADLKKSTDPRCAEHRAAGSRFIVLSDSNSFIDQMTERFKGEMSIISTSGMGPLVHAETILLGSDNAVKGLYRAMIDFYILSHCRYHVASLSTFDGTTSIAHGAEVRRYDMEIHSTCKDTPNNIGVWQRDVHAKRFH